jgi:hypothetical protein
MGRSSACASRGRSNASSPRPLLASVTFVAWLRSMWQIKGHIPQRQRANTECRRIVTLGVVTM